MSADSFQGEGLVDSPWKEALKKLEKAEEEIEYLKCELAIADRYAERFRKAANEKYIPDEVARVERDHWKQMYQAAMQLLAAQRERTTLLKESARKAIELLNYSLDNWVSSEDKTRVMRPAISALSKAILEE